MFCYNFTLLRSSGLAMKRKGIAFPQNFGFVKFKSKYSMPKIEDYRRKTIKLTKLTF